MTYDTYALRDKKIQSLYTFLQNLTQTWDFSPKTSLLGILFPTRLCDITVKTLPYDPLLGLLHQTVSGLIGTSYRGDRLDMLVSLAPSTFLVLEGGTNVKLCPLIQF